MTTARWWQALRFDLDATARVAHAGELLIGLGNPATPDQAGVALTQKYRGSPFGSVTDTVRHADPTQVATWRARLGADLSRCTRVVVEDLSIDTCLSLLLLEQVLRTGGTGLVEPWLAAWCDVVTRWEQGYTKSGGALDDSIPQLITTLGHSYLGGRDANDGAAPLIDATTLAEGLDACLTLFEDVLAQREPPSTFDIRLLRPSAPLARARAHFEYEREQYRRAVAHARTCQLSVPLQASGRALLVDALFLEEESPSALLKVFARADDTSWTGRGYEVLGLYRPRLAGTGDDMVISVSMESGLTLAALWQALERREDAAWAGARPCDHPRAIASYADRTDSPDEPWWDDSGRFTLVAAPKALGPVATAPPGTRLDWYADVLPAVWDCYRPIPDGLSIVDGLADRPDAASCSKALAVCRWPKVDRAVQYAAIAADSPTFRGWLKSLSSGGPPVASISDLPSPKSYRTVVFDGGYAIVHRDGVTVLDDWTRPAPPLAHMTAVLVDMAAAWDAMARFREDVDASLASFRTLANEKRRPSRAALEAWEKRSWESRARILESSAKALSQMDEWPLNEFRAALAEVLDLGAHRRETLETFEQIDHATAEVHKMRAEHRNRLFRAIGAGLALGFTAKEVTEALQSAFVPNTFEWQIRMFVDPVRDVALLHEYAESLHHWEIGALVAGLAGIAVGAALSFWFEARMSDE